MKLWHLMAANAWVALFFSLVRTAIWVETVPVVALADVIIFAVAGGTVWFIAGPVARWVLAPDGRDHGGWRLAMVVMLGGVAAAVGTFCWPEWQ